MKKWKRLLAPVLAAVMLWGCLPQPGTTAEETTALPEAESQEEELYRQLFDLEQKVELELQMSETEIAALQRDYEIYSAQGSKSPIYRMADLKVTITGSDGTVNTYTVEQVGVRMKGNTSRTDFYNEKEGIYNLIHLKLSFQETFDGEEYGSAALVWTDEEARTQRKNRTFATLEKLDLRWNKCNDGTYIREYYAFEMFRDNGVLAPRANLASVDWAGLHMGVFTMVEPVDKVFLKRNLPEELRGGDLYKCGWTDQGANFTAVRSMGVEDEEKGEFFTYDLKTNKKKSDHSSLIAFITALNSDNMTKETFGQLVNVDNFLSFAAVTYLLGNQDDSRNNYNNFYIYFPPEGGCMLIPTDYDRCLGLTHEWDPTGDALTTEDPFGTTMATGSSQESPLYLYSVCQGGFYVAEFAEKLETLLRSKWATADHFESIFAKAAAQYADLTIPEKTFRNSADHRTTMTLDGSDGNWKVSDYLAAKCQTLTQALAEVDTSVAPQIPARFYIRADFNDWSVRSEYAMTAAGESCCQFLLTGGTFKVYDKREDRWYGTEAIVSSAVEWETDGHGNIILPKGQYRISFDWEKMAITIEKT